MTEENEISVTEEQLEEIIDRKVEEWMEKLQEDQKELDIKKTQKDIKKDSSDSSSLNRRQFLKTVGLGAGALSFASMTSAWSILQPQNQGTSEITAGDADTLDGNEGSHYLNHNNLTNIGSSDHHTRPTATNNQKQTVQYTTSGSTDATEDFPQQVEQITINMTDGDLGSYDIQNYYSGTSLASGSISNNGSTTHSFNAQPVSVVLSDNRTSYYEVTGTVVEIHSHGHSI